MVWHVMVVFCSFFFISFRDVDHGFLDLSLSICWMENLRYVLACCKR